MIQSGVVEERHTIPRWNTIKTARLLGEMDSLKTPTVVYHSRDDNLVDLLSTWKFEKNLPLAIEIISASRLQQSEIDISDVFKYAVETISHMDSAPDLLKDFLLGESENIEHNSHQKSIELLRKKLLSFPRNSLLWIELAREYLIIGLSKKSERALRIAYGLAPDNRTTIRAVARFYAHEGDLEKAHYYLTNCPSIKEDPWILSSEIAISNESHRTSKFVKLGQQMLVNADFKPLCLSELASELGTMDFFAGNSKQGKRKLGIAKLQPHENAVAQMAWINQHAYNISSILEEMSYPDCNFEAETCWFFQKGEWKNALNVAGQWQEYQPFSRIPALICSSIAVDYLNDSSKAIESLVSALKSNPNDMSVLNNYAYALILNGNLKEASDIVQRINSLFDFQHDTILCATNGLLQYRTGNPELGKSMYLNAVELAKQKNDQELYYRAILYFAREEQRLGNDIRGLLEIVNSAKYHTLHMQYLPVIQNFGLSSS